MVTKINIFTDKDQELPFADADVAIFLGGMPRQPGMERNDIYKINAHIFQIQGKYLDKVAKKSCKSLVVANPVLMSSCRLAPIV